MARRILIAPDKFKGSLSATQAAESIAQGILAAEPDAIIDLCPIADGGEGFAESVASSMQGERVEVMSVDARFRDIVSHYYLADSQTAKTAIIEMSETAGMWRLGEDVLNPMKATTRGVGIQIRDAIESHKANKVILGLGGSATNDGGAGMAAELGVRFLDITGQNIDPCPEMIPMIKNIDMTGRITLPEIIAACDVDNPLLGPKGATAVYSPQKGSTETTRPKLEAALEHLMRLSDGAANAEVSGTGAAGGLGFGLLQFADAKLVSGFDLISELLELENRIAEADLVITGEGSLDRQSLSGKGPVALAQMAQRFGVPVIGICGTADDATKESGLFSEILALTDTDLPIENLISNAALHLTDMVQARLQTRH